MISNFAFHPVAVSSQSKKMTQSCILRSLNSVKPFLCNLKQPSFNHKNHSTCIWWHYIKYYSTICICLTSTHKTTTVRWPWWPRGSWWSNWSHGTWKPRQPSLPRCTRLSYVALSTLRWERGKEMMSICLTTQQGQLDTEGKWMMPKKRKEVQLNLAIQKEGFDDVHCSFKLVETGVIRWESEEN